MSIYMINHYGYEDIIYSQYAEKNVSREYGEN